MKKNRTWLKNYFQTVSNYLLLIYFFPFIIFFFSSQHILFSFFSYMKVEATQPKKEI